MRSWDVERVGWCVAFVLMVGTAVGVPTWMAVTGQRSEPFVASVCAGYKVEHYQAYHCHCTSWNAATQLPEESCCWYEDAMRSVCARRAPARCTGNIYWPTNCAVLEE